MTKEKMRQESLENFQLIPGENQSFYLLKLNGEQIKSKKFYFLDEGINQIMEWRNNKIISNGEKLDLFSLLLQENLPICSLETVDGEKILKRREILEKYEKTIQNIFFILRLTKNKEKAKKVQKTNTSLPSYARGVL